MRPEETHLLTVSCVGLILLVRPLAIMLKQRYARNGIESSSALPSLLECSVSVEDW